MKSRFTKLPTLLYSLAVILGLSCATPARAGLTLVLDIIHDNAGGVYTCSPILSTNANGPDSTPITYHQILSPQGSNFAGGLGNGAYFNRDTFADFNAFMQAFTNGTWTLIMNVGDASQKTYTFTVSAPTLTSNLLIASFVDYPTNNATNILRLPDFAWHGPTNWDSLFVYVYASAASTFQYAVFGAPGVTTNTNTFLPPSLTNGNYYFYIDYTKTNVPGLITTSTPMDASNHPLANWVSGGQIDSGNQCSFTVNAPPVPTTNHVLIAHYSFDDTNNPGTDVSGNGFNLDVFAGFGGTVNPDTNSIMGLGALLFTTNSGGPNGAFTGWNTTPPLLLSALAGSFTISLWVKTSDPFGDPGDQAFSGAGIVTADVSGLANDLVPVALTAGQVAFNTGGTSDDTLNSHTLVNDGAYHHIVVTRDQPSGQKQIYIDGVLDVAGFATTNILSDPQRIVIGALADVSSPGAFDTGHYNGYAGYLDDLQFYSGVISASDVAYLHANPGLTAVPYGLPPHTLVAHYPFDNSNSIGTDTSGNGLNFTIGGGFGDPSGFTNAAKAGAGAFFFTAASNGQGEFQGWNPTPPVLLSTIASDFSISVWVKTTSSYGNPGDKAYNGAGIVTADVPGLANDLVPISLTAGQVAFNTGGTSDDTLHSQTLVNDGAYHHIIVTRSQSTGLKQIYIDAVLDSSNVATTNLLNAPQLLTIGSMSDAGNANAAATSYYGGYAGIIDDLQFYSGVLLQTNISILHSNPGLTISNNVVALNPFNVALNDTNEGWSTSGDALWFAEPTNSFDGAAAAQSGVLQDNQSSILQTTISGPGTISFYWQSVANDDSFDLQFFVDGSQYDDISFQTSWTQDSFIISDPGPHVLTWNANTFNDTGSSPTDAGYLDLFVFTPAPSLALQLTSQGRVGNNYQFSFTSIANYTHTVQYSTNLAVSNWQTYTNIPGDGTMKTILVPVNSPVKQYFRVATQ